MIYQLSHEMCHYAIRQRKHNKGFPLSWYGRKGEIGMGNALEHGRFRKRNLFAGMVLTVRNVWCWP